MNKQDFDIELSIDQIERSTEQFAIEKKVFEEKGFFNVKLYDEKNRLYSAASGKSHYHGLYIDQSQEGIVIRHK